MQLLKQNIARRRQITVGTPMILTLVVEHHKDIQLFPRPISIESEYLEAYSPKITSRKNKTTRRSQIVTQLEYKFIAFEPGEHEIPPIIIKGLDAEGQEYYIASQPVKFTVRGIKPHGASDIRDIKNPMPVPRSLLPYVLFSGLFVAGMVVAVYLYARKLKHPVETAPEITMQRPPHEVAYDELRKIEQMDLVAKGEMKEYYTRVSDVIRTYIEERYEVAALELTTGKLLETLAAQQLPKEHIAQIGGFLRSCDFVKFAQYQPSVSEAQEVLQQARDIIDNAA